MVRMEEWAMEAKANMTKQNFKYRIEGADLNRNN